MATKLVSKILQETKFVLKLATRHTALLKVLLHARRGRRALQKQLRAWSWMSTFQKSK